MNSERHGILPLSKMVRTLNSMKNTVDLSLKTSPDVTKRRFLPHRKQSHPTNADPEMGKDE